MSRLHRPLAIAAIAALLFATATGVAAAQATGARPPAPTRADCATMKTMMDHGTEPMDHAAMMKQMADCGMKVPDMKMAGLKMAEPQATSAVPTMPGEAAFGAIGEVVRMLENDPATDWSRVNIEALRQHLIDMDEVTLHSRVAQHNVPGGFTADVTGSASTAAAIRRMIPDHARMFSGSQEFDAKVQLIPAGVRLTLLAHTPGDSALVARVRGLGVIGFLTEGDHHARHHLAIARGDPLAHVH